jgi:small GTP-binding protein
MRAILTAEQAGLLADERRILADLRVALATFGAADDAQATLAHSIEQLDELFLLVVIGEFNAGKSAVINALLGRRVLLEGVTPTTAEINVLVHDEGGIPGRLEPHVTRIPAGVDILRELRIVDTPGTNAIMREHEVLTAGFVPRSDLVLFVTSADRPFTETERAFLEQIRDWGKKIVVAINKIDILEREDEVREVVAFVADQSRLLLGATPEIFPVSARAALRGKEGDRTAWAASGFEALERYIHETLDEAGRLRLKLLNPLGVGGHLAERYLASTRERLALLRDDLGLLDDVERQLGVYERDTTAQFGLRMAEIDTILLELERRGHEFFDETLRIGRLFDLLNRARVQQAFERDVVGDAPQQIERKVNELVDWMIESDFRQWQAVTTHLADRRREYKDRIIDDPESSGFHLDRTRLLEAIGGDAQRVVDTYDKAQESRALADGARNAVAAAAATGVGALGLGTLVSVAASTAAADVTGIVMASAMAGIGFFIIPAKRRRAKAEMRAKISALRARLSDALRDRFQSEIQRSGTRIRESIAPYSRFVRAEREKLTDQASGLDRLRSELETVKQRITTVLGGDAAAAG